MIGAGFEADGEGIYLGGINGQSRLRHGRYRLHQPAHGLLLLCGLEGYFIDIEVEEIGAGRFLALYLAAQVIEGIRVAEHGLLHGDLEVFDAAFLVVLGCFDGIGNREEAARVVGVAEAHGFNALGVWADELAFAQDDAGGVDVFADDDEGTVRTGDVH